MQYEGHLVSDLSFFNEFKTYQDIAVIKMHDQKVLSVKVNQRKDKKYAIWEPLVKSLQKSEDPGLLLWANTIKKFCHTHMKVMQRQSRKRTKSELRRQFFCQVTLETELQIQRFFTSYPCIQLKFRLKNHQMELKELLFSEWLVKELGYSLDSFILTLLQEGIPQLMPYDNPLAGLVFKALIENYFTFGENGYITPEIDSVILMKGSFAKNVRFKTLFLMNYETNTFGMDIVLAISSKGEPYITDKKNHFDLLNKNFIEVMTTREKEVECFLSRYYNQDIQKVYTNIHRTCSIKEVNSSSEDIVLKKYEE